MLSKEQERRILTYLHADHLGSSALATDASRNITSKQTYYAFGVPRPQDVGAMPTDYGFTGQKLDAGTAGLMYYGARYYDPYLNRWVQPDTIVPNPYDPQDLNRYTYTRNNPIRYTDPSGHDVPDNARDFFTGVLQQWLHNNSIGQARDSLAVKFSDTDWNVAGRHVGNGIAFWQGLVEVAVGGGSDVAGGAVCVASAGPGCVVGVPVVAAGTAVVVHGGAVAAGALEEEVALFSKKNRNKGDSDPEMLGAKGTRSDPRNLWEGKHGKNDVRLDVESLDPGYKKGSMHVQEGKYKYQYDFESHRFLPDLKFGTLPPNWVYELFDDPGFMKEWQKGLTILGVGD